ncbi:MAG: DUF4352 domain-containing protein [Firmicutes bacterium]|nr:DUF4352 domain-containing protein [Bacillota bacterium]
MSLMGSPKGAQLEQPMPKRAWLAAIAIMLIGLILAGCGGEIGSDRWGMAREAAGENGGKPSSVQPGTASGAVSKNVKYSPFDQPRRVVGESAGVGYLVVTLHSAGWGRDYGYPHQGVGQELSQARAPGQNLLAMNVSIRNGGQAPVSISSFLMFSMYDQDGYRRFIEPFAAVTNAVDGTLGPGETVRGELVYDVPESHREWTLVFQPDLPGTEGERVVFRISKEDLSGPAPEDQKATPP